MLHNHQLTFLFIVSFFRVWKKKKRRQKRIWSHSIHPFNSINIWLQYLEWSFHNTSFPFPSSCWFWTVYFLQIKTEVDKKTSQWRRIERLVDRIEKKNSILSNQHHSTDIRTDNGLTTIINVHCNVYSSLFSNIPSS